MSRMLLRLAASLTVGWILYALWEHAYQAGLDDGHPEDASLEDVIAAGDEAQADGP